MIVTLAYFQVHRNDTESQYSSNSGMLKYEVKYLKQMNLYKGNLFELNEVFGIDSNPCTKEEQW